MYARFVPESGRATFEVMHWGLDPGRATQVQAGDVKCPVFCITGSDDKLSIAQALKRLNLGGTRPSQSKPSLAQMSDALLMLVAGTSGADSLEDEMRRSPGTNSLDDDSQRLKADGVDNPGTDSLRDDSEKLRNRTDDEDTDGLDNGSMDDNES